MKSILTKNDYNFFIIVINEIIIKLISLQFLLAEFKRRRFLALERKSEAKPERKNLEEKLEELDSMLSAQY